jgi:hypothetical protein
MEAEYGEENVTSRGWQNVEEVQRQQFGHSSPVIEAKKLLNRRGGSSGSEIIAMMQSAQPRHGNDATTCAGIRFCFSPCRSSLSQREMRPVLVAGGPGLDSETGINLRRRSNLSSKSTTFSTIFASTTRFSPSRYTCASPLFHPGANVA